MPTNAKAAGAIAALALTLAACGSSKHGTSSTAHAATSATATPTSAQALVVTLSTPRTEPVAGGFWPITVHAHTASGAPASGTVSYAFLFGGAVVAQRPGGHMRGGVFHDRLEFPAKAVGYPLTVQTTVRSAGGVSGSTKRSVTVHP